MQAGKSTKLSTRQAIEDRRDKIMELARAGASMRTIGEQLGVTAATVSRDWRARIAENAKHHKDTSKLRTAEIDRIDALMMAWWNAALTDVVALREVRALIELRSRFLGLEAPKQHRVQGQLDIRRQSVELHVHYVGADKQDSDEPAG